MQWLESPWYRISPLVVLLFPLSCLFRVLVLLRRALFFVKLLPTTRLPVPVIVVGNISVGGTGKTPLVMWLVEFLKANGYSPGVVSRGYGATQANPERVTSVSSPDIVGDEPVMIAKRCHCPVWVGAARRRVAHALLQFNRECDVVVSDDGLQHYYLARDIEIAVVDGTRRFGNGMLLPAGPLREPINRLRSVDAVVINQGKGFSDLPNAFHMELIGDQFHNLLAPANHISPLELAQKRIVAMAGIGNPQRFFDHLNTLGLGFATRVFPDHHRYNAADLEFANVDAVLLTEKDAVKCASIASEKFWVLTVNAKLDSRFGDLILKKLGAKHGP